MNAPAPEGLLLGDASATAPPLPSPQPPPATATTPGAGRLAVSLVDGLSAVTTATATAPLHLLLPRPRGGAVWAVPTSLGGGLVAGDRLALDLACAPDTTLAIITQASTKVYKTDGPWCGSTVTASIAPGALLALLPDPVTPFAGARFRQDQTFTLAEGASLVLVDAVTCGRAARGEHWAWSAYHSRLRVSIAGAPWLHDALRLEPTDPAGKDLPARMGRFAALATVIAVGPRARDAAAALLAAAAAAPMAPWRANTPHTAPAVRLSASPLPHGAILRAAATDAATLAHAIRATLGPILAPALGEDPWTRRG
jgi:urease accessory protein